MACSPKEILGHLMTSSIAAALLMKRDGSVVERAPSQGEGAETVQAATRHLVALWDSAGTDLGLGRPRALLVESGGGLFSIMPAGGDTLLVAVGTGSCSIGQMRRQMQRAHDATHAPTRMADAGIPERERVRAAPGPVGEVVVIGVGTFRLTARLVETLSQIRGVRSARLRAYTLGRIAIEVAFEEGGSLAAITGARLAEFSLEVIERSATRLVLVASSRPPVRREARTGSGEGVPRAGVALSGGVPYHR